MGNIVVKCNESVSDLNLLKIGDLVIPFNKSDSFIKKPISISWKTINLSADIRIKSEDNSLFICDINGNKIENSNSFYLSNGNGYLIIPNKYDLSEINLSSGDKYNFRACNLNIKELLYTPDDIDLNITYSNCWGDISLLKRTWNIYKDLSFNYVTGDFSIISSYLAQKVVSLGSTCSRKIEWKSEKHDWILFQFAKFLYAKDLRLFLIGLSKSTPVKDAATQEHEFSVDENFNVSEDDELISAMKILVKIVSKLAVNKKIYTVVAEKLYENGILIS